MRSSDVPTTFRDMWETRPARPRDDRMVAGVAAGIARRYDIDPVLVRVGFVVAAFTGIGAALYIAGWIALPDTPAAPGEPKRRFRVHPVLLIGLVIAFAVGIGGIFDDNQSLLLPAIAAAVLLFLLHANRSDRGPVDPAAAAEPGAVTAGPSLVKDLPGLPPQPTPPAWDPLGAAPFAWDLPEPSASPPPPPPRRLPVTAVTLGATLLASGITVAIMLLTGTLTGAMVPTVLGVALAVLGTGLVVGSVVRAGRGLIPFAIIGSLVTWGALAAPLDRINFDGFAGFDDIQITPTTTSQLAPSYTTGAGDIALDLRRLDLTGGAAPVDLKLTSGAGDIDIEVPPDADVTFTGSSGLGSVVFDNRAEVEGPGAEFSVTDLGADGVPSGRPIVINAQAGAGDVEVHRG